MIKEKLKMSGLEEWLKHLNDEARREEIENDFCGGELTDFYGNELGVYEFQEGLGMCGILLPSGHFLKCHDKQHSMIASVLNEQEKFLSLYFSSRLIFEGDKSIFSFHLDNNGGLFDYNFSRERMLYNMGLGERMSELYGKKIITNSQVEFICEHYDFMNSSQKNMINVVLLDKTRIANVFSKEKIKRDVCVLDVW